MQELGHVTPAHAGERVLILFSQTSYERVFVAHTHTDDVCLLAQAAVLCAPRTRSDCVASMRDKPQWLSHSHARAHPGRVGTGLRLYDPPRTLVGLCPRRLWV